MSEKTIMKKLLHAVIQENLIDFECLENQINIKLAKQKKNILIDNVKKFALQKFRLSDKIYLQDQQKTIPISTIKDLLPHLELELKHNCTAEDWQDFIVEINNCLRNALLTETHMKSVNEVLMNRMQAQGQNNFSQFVMQEFNLAERLILFEQWAARGHPYHPCYKTKLGLSERDYKRYSAEFDQSTPIVLAAIAKNKMHIHSIYTERSYLDWFEDTFPEIFFAWQQHLQQNNLKSQLFLPIFIHPWQYEHIIKEKFAALLQQQTLIIIPEVIIEGKSTLSFRTLIFKDTQTLPHLKLPVCIQCTSAIRTVSPSSAHNGPTISTLIRQILTQEHSINQHLSLAAELYGLALDDQSDENAKHLSLIFRENPSNLLQANQLPIVVAALFETLPHQSYPLFLELIKNFSALHLDNVLSYFEHYTEIVLKAFFDLYLVFGIALEGHQQNTIAIFENNLPVRMLIRDLGGIRIHQETLQLHCNDALTLHPRSVTLTQNSKEVTNKFIHTILYSHLGEIILLLADYFNTAEQPFWRILKNQLEYRFSILQSRVTRERYAETYDAIFNQPWKLKCLMQMRLKKTYSKYLYTNINNILQEV